MPMLPPAMSVVRRSFWVMGGMVPPIDPSGIPCEQPCATPLRPRQSGGKALRRGGAISQMRDVRSYACPSCHMLICDCKTVSGAAALNNKMHMLIQNDETTSP
jgi:hypothetical protein